MPEKKDIVKPFFKAQVPEMKIVKCQMPWGTVNTQRTERSKYIKVGMKKDLYEDQKMTPGTFHVKSNACALTIVNLEFMKEEKKMWKISVRVEILLQKTI